MQTTYAIHGKSPRFFILPTNSKARFPLPVYPKGINGGTAKTREEAENWLARLDTEETERQATMAAKRAERKAQRNAWTTEAETGFQVGCLLVASWGYDQTNVDAFQVVERYGKTGVVLREVGWKINKDREGRDCDYRRPVKDLFLDTEPLRKRISGGCVKIDRSRTAFPDKGTEYYCSWYA